MEGAIALFPNSKDRSWIKDKGAGRKRLDRERNKKNKMGRKIGRRAVGRKNNSGELGNGGANKDMYEGGRGLWRKREEQI